MVTLRAAVALSVLLLATGCGLQSPLPQTPEDVAIQPSDVRGLDRCPGSGAIATYLQQLRQKSPDAYTTIQDGWKQLQDSGAQDAAVVTYAESSSACGGALGANQGISATSFVIKYRDSGAASSAWQRGILGFPTPAEGQQVPGLVRGSGTGLGSNSWEYQQTNGPAALYLAFWQKGAFDVFLLTTDLDPPVSRKLASTVSGRIH